MPRAECFYEILGIPESASPDEVKRAYKKEALIWHPDKNQANPDQAHAKFQAILKAYETLSDSREREWYDRHKDQILSDDNSGEPGCLSLFQFFSSACYANFDDQVDGFYTVYRQVFDQIAEEERKAIQLAERYTKNKRKANRQLEDAFPTFGNSNSPYDQVVRPFYAFWTAFSTVLTFDHLDKFNTTEAENRRIVRAMEKENKKVKDVAKKERNTNVRNLVEFVKKRDKRLKAHKVLVEQQNELNRQKTAEKQRQQREKGIKDKVAYQPSDYLNMNDVEEQLEKLDSQYQDLRKGKRSRRKQVDSDNEGEEVEHEVEKDEDDEEINCDDWDHRGTDEKVQKQRHQVDDDVVSLATKSDKTKTNVVRPSNEKVVSGESDRFAMNGAKMSHENHGVHDDNAETEDTDEEEDFFCPACNKQFRTINAFENHEGSKKHKQNLQKLTQLLKEEERKLHL